MLAGARLTDRDREILVALARVAYLTTRQIAILAGFGSERRARGRMAGLRDLGLAALVAKGARGAVNPSWTLTKRGEKLVPTLDAPLHYRAQSLGAPLLGEVLVVSGVYAALAASGSEIDWHLLPDLRWSAQAKASGMHTPRPWAVLTLNSGARVAFELDRPARRGADIEAVIARWTRWRIVESDWRDTDVMYVVPSEVRRATVTQVAAARTWFAPMSNPATVVGQDLAPAGGPSSGDA